MGMSGFGVAKPASAKRFPRPAMGITMFSIIDCLFLSRVLVAGYARQLDHNRRYIRQCFKVGGLAWLKENDVSGPVWSPVHPHLAVQDQRHFGGDFVMVAFFAFSRLVGFDRHLSGLGAKGHGREVADEPSFCHVI